MFMSSAVLAQGHQRFKTPPARIPVLKMLIDITNKYLGETVYSFAQWRVNLWFVRLLWGWGVYTPYIHTHCMHHAYV